MNNSIKSNDDNNDENKLYQYATLRPIQQKNQTKLFNNKTNNFFRNSFNELNFIDTYSTLMEDTLSASSTSSTTAITSPSLSSSSTTSSDETSLESPTNLNNHTLSSPEPENKIVAQCLSELDAYLEAIENSTSLDQTIISDNPAGDDDTTQLLNLNRTTTSSNKYGFSTFPKNRNRTPTRGGGGDEPSSFLAIPRTTSTPTSPSVSPTRTPKLLHHNASQKQQLQQLVAKGSTTFNRGQPQRNTIVTCTRSSSSIDNNSGDDGLDIDSEQQLRKSRLKKTGLFYYLIFVFFYFFVRLFKYEDMKV